MCPQRTAAIISPVTPPTPVQAGSLDPAQDLWQLRLDELGLTIEASPVGPLVARLYAELGERGIDLLPPCFVANEWGCPDGQPLIGIPFYLLDPRFHAMEDEFADDLEDDARILIGLRHEAGHALNYAYQLWQDPEWKALFGDFTREYGDDYEPQPFSSRFVRHLPGWYGQKHPDEDFAETFAVWLTPGLDWRTTYAGTAALAKLEYTERAMARVGKLPPKVGPGLPDPDELDFTVSEFYEHRHDEDAPPVGLLGVAVDADLRDLFHAEGPGLDAASLVREKRRVLMKSVSGYAGSRMYVVKVLVDHLATRLRTLGLRAVPGKEADALIGFTALVGTLTTNFLQTGRFAE